MSKTQKYNYRNFFVAKLVLLLMLSLFVSSCNSENAPDCFQNVGDIVRTEVTVADFKKITVFEEIAVVLKQGDTQKVEIETGEYLLDGVTAVVEGDRLVLRNENTCNLFRENGVTTVYVTSPNINEIRSSTGLAIRSDGVLSYTSLTLYSESYSNPETETTDGEFDLNINTSDLNIVVNGIAYFKLRGATENLNLTVAAGDSRIEAENLIAQHVSLSHRGTNDILVNPQQSISGIIRGTGDVISYNRPETVDVEEIFNGTLIFK